MAALRCATTCLKEITQKSVRNHALFLPNMQTRMMGALAEKRKSLLSLDILTLNTPTNHQQVDLTKVYRISVKDMKTIMTHGFPTREGNRVKEFTDFHLLVRKPVLQVLDAIRNMKDGDKPPRFVFYGEDGSGKSIALSHVILYCAYAKWLILHIPKVHEIANSKSPTEASTWREGRLDQPEEAVAWLKAFKIVNQHLLDEVITSKDYIWGRQETIPQGSTITKVVDTGMSRANFASDAVGIVLKEIQNQEHLKVLYAVDSFNRMFKASTDEKYTKWADPESLSLLRHFTRILEPEKSIKSGCYAVSLSRTGNYGKYIHSIDVEDQIGKVGTALLGEHIPVKVQNFSASELHTYLLLLRETDNFHKEVDEKLEQEISFLTDRNPTDINRLVRGF